LDKNGQILVVATTILRPRGIVKNTGLGNILSRSKMIRRLVLDVLKPHNPGVVELSEALSHLEGVEGVNIIIYEMRARIKWEHALSWDQNAICRPDSYVDFPRP